MNVNLEKQPVNLHAGTFGTEFCINGKVFGLWDGVEKDGDAGYEQARKGNKSRVREFYVFRQVNMIQTKFCLLKPISNPNIHY